MAKIFVTTDNLGIKHIMDERAVDAVLPLSDVSLASIVKIEEYEAVDAYETPERIKALHDSTFKAKQKREKAETKKALKATIKALQAALDSIG